MKPRIITTVIPIALAVSGSIAGAQSGAATATTRSTTPAAAAVAAPMVPGGAVLSAIRVTVTPVGGGAATTASVDANGAFALTGLAPGHYHVALASVTVPKQTQGATFGEKVNAGVNAAGSAVSQGAPAGEARHEMAKNSIGNIRGRIDPNNGGMPARISMNLTVGRTSRVLEIDGAPVDIEIGADRRLTGVISSK